MAEPKTARNTGSVVAFVGGVADPKGRKDCRTGRSCLYLKSLEDIDMPTLQKLIERSIADMKKAYEVE